VLLPVLRAPNRKKLLFFVTFSSLSNILTPFSLSYYENAIFSTI
jgi:hypothetical protein